MGLDCTEKEKNACLRFSVGPVHCSRDLQLRISVIFSLKLSLMALFTHLKIILIQWFQFLIFINKRYSIIP